MPRKKDIENKEASNKKKHARERYKPRTQQEAEAFGEEMNVIRGNVHTVEMHVPNYNYTSDKLFVWLTKGTTRDHKYMERNGQYGTTMIINPNNCLQQECLSMEVYFDIMKGIMLRMEHEGDYVLTRLDFKLDVNPPPDVKPFWIKLNDLLVYAYIAYKGIKVKGRVRSSDPVTGQHKSTKASSKGFAIESYNKRLQAPEEGIDYRTELRCLSINGKPGARYCDEREALQKLKSIVAAIPAFYREAIDAQRVKIVNLYNKTAPTDGQRSPHEFLRANSEAVFDWEQIRQFAEAIGYTTERAKKFAYNFVERNPHVVLVSQADLVRLCTLITSRIDDYLRD